MGVQEYLKTYPIPEDDIQHVQDGSWVDTRDSSSDPTWYHWHIPMGVWKGQFAAFTTATGKTFDWPTNFDGTPLGHAVSMEYGYHYLERNFALLRLRSTTQRPQSRSGSTAIRTTGLLRLTRRSALPTRATSSIRT